MIIASRKFQVFALLGIIAFLPACFGRKTAAQESNFYLINVLSKESYDDCTIAGSINVPFEQFEEYAKKLDKKAEIVVYCANYSCSASGEAAKMLKNMGFQQVWAYEGGTAEWYTLGLQDPSRFPVKGACKASYLTAPNERAEETDSSVPVITAQELYEKMLAHGLIS